MMSKKEKLQLVCVFLLMGVIITTMCMFPVEESFKEPRPTPYISYKEYKFLWNDGGNYIVNSTGYIIVWDGNQFFNRDYFNKEVFRSRGCDEALQWMIDNA